MSIRRSEHLMFIGLAAGVLTTLTPVEQQAIWITCEKVGIKKGTGFYGNYQAHIYTVLIQVLLNCASKALLKPPKPFKDFCKMF